MQRIFERMQRMFVRIHASSGMSWNIRGCPWILANVRYGRSRPYAQDVEPRVKLLLQRPGIDQRWSESFEVTHVACRDGRLSGKGDSGDLHVADLDAPA